MAHQYAARFLSRPNRFVARVELSDGSEQTVHVASSGRMADLLRPGAPVMVTRQSGPGRKTTGLLALVQSEGIWVSVDTAQPGRLIKQALQAGTLAPFKDYTHVRPEFTYGESRIDFLLSADDRPPCLLEVKSVTSVLTDPDGVRVARFPDAPTQRGARHLHELVRAQGDGYRAAVCFVVQREDARACGSWDAIDPGFGKALRAARDAGVEIFSWCLHISPENIAISEPLPIRF